MAMRDIGSPAPRLKAMRRPKALGNRRSGRAGEPAAGESVGASESLDDVPQDPRVPSYPPVGPADRLCDLYGSLSTLLGVRAGIGMSPKPRAHGSELHGPPRPRRPIVSDLRQESGALAAQAGICAGERGNPPPIPIHRWLSV